VGRVGHRAGSRGAGERQLISALAAEGERRFALRLRNGEDRRQPLGAGNLADSAWKSPPVYGLFYAYRNKPRGEARQCGRAIPRPDCAGTPRQPGAHGKTRVEPCAKNLALTRASTPYAMPRPRRPAHGLPAPGQSAPSLARPPMSRVGLKLGPHFSGERPTRPCPPPPLVEAGLVHSVRVMLENAPEGFQ